MRTESLSRPSLARAGIVMAVLFAALFAARALPAFAAAPTVTGVSPNQGAATGGTVVTITGTGFTGATGVTFGGTPGTALTVNSNTSITVTTPSHSVGTFDVIVSADGASSGTGTADDFTFVAQPTITGLSPNNGPTGGGNLVTVTGTGFTGVSSVNFGGTSVSASNVSATSLQVTAPAGSGVVSLSITTAGGTTANTPADDYTYNAAVPSITSISPTTGDVIGGTIVTITGTGFSGATAVSFGGSPAAAFTVNSNVQITATAPAHAAGTISISVTGPGGTSPDTSADNFLYGSVLPVVTSLSPTGGPVGGGNTVTVNGTGFTGASLVTFGGTPGTSIVVTNDNLLTVTAPAHLAGSVDVLVTRSSGTSLNTTADNYLYGAAVPTITAVTPNTGPLVGGNTVTITGTGLTGATSVSFGGAAGTSIVVATGGTSLTVVAPAHAAGGVNIVVTTPVGANIDTAADNYTYSNAPFITGVTPASGPAAGGTSVTITGVGFTGATAVTFGATPATAFTVNSSTQITATSPAHAAGTVDIVVTGPDGSSTTQGPENDFLYGSGPSITSISPASGPIAGGTTVTITGTGFTGATAVKFGSTAATSFSIVSDTQITAVSPAGANGVVQVSVTTPIGTTPDTAADNFTYGTGSTITFTLYFRWTLIVWNGKDNQDVAAALKNLESPDNTATNDISGIVTAIFHYNNPQQKFEGWFPGSANVPGANDFTAFKKGEAYWIAISSSGSTTWTTVGE